MTTELMRAVIAQLQALEPEVQDEIACRILGGSFAAGLTESREIGSKLAEAAADFAAGRPVGDGAAFWAAGLSQAAKMPVIT